MRRRANAPRSGLTKRPWRAGGDGWAWGRRAWWGQLMSVFLVSAVGCLRPAQQRAEKDEQVGRAGGHGLKVEVDQGLAHVAQLASERLVLWGGVPAFELTLEREPTASEALELTLHNAMPGVELSAPASVEVSAASREELSSTRVRWQLRVPGTEPVKLRIAPPDADDATPFVFGVLSDVQEAIDGFHEMITRVNQEPELRFLLGAGDLTSNGTRGELERFRGELEALRVPYFATLGNHELGVDPPLFHEFFGRGNFSFSFHDVRFTMLDSASATLDPIVYEWLDEWLDAGREQTHVVAMHIPPMDPSGTRHGAFASKAEAAKLLNHLKLHDVDLTVYGHIHTYIHFDNAGIDAHIAGGGGAIPQRGDGIGRHYLVVRATPGAGITQTRVVEVDGDWSF